MTTSSSACVRTFTATLSHARTHARTQPPTHTKPKANAQSPHFLFPFCALGWQPCGSTPNMLLPLSLWRQRRPLQQQLSESGRQSPTTDVMLYCCPMTPKTTVVWLFEPSSLVSSALVRDRSNNHRYALHVKQPHALTLTPTTPLCSILFGCVSLCSALGMVVHGH